MPPARVYNHVNPLALVLSLLVSVPSTAAQSGSAAAPFNPGERLEYTLSYGLLPAGTMTTRVVGLEEFDGRPAYHFLFEAKTNRAVGFVYQLESREESWFDARELYSLRYRRTTVENDKPRNKDVRFDQERNLQIEGGESNPTSPRAVDQVAIIYYLRMLHLSPGARHVLRNMPDPDDNPLVIRVLKRERIRVAAGTFETYLIDLDLRTDSGLFKEGGENRIWVTADARHIPVRISSKVGPASIQVELVDFTDGRPVD